MENMQESHSAGSKNYSKLIGTFLVVIIAVALVWYLSKSFGEQELVSSSSSEYQAVFLDNNQVYFGKLSGENSGFPVLRDIFYLRLAQPPQPQSAGAQIPDINLVKLGTELHGPKDEMRINRDHILFIEDLEEGGQVMQAIRAFKEFQEQQAQQ